MILNTEEWQMSSRQQAGDRRIKADGPTSPTEFGLRECQVDVAAAAGCDLQEAGALGWIFAVAGKLPSMGHAGHCLRRFTGQRHPLSPVSLTALAPPPLRSALLRHLLLHASPAHADTPPGHTQGRMLHYLLRRYYLDYSMII